MRRCVRHSCFLPCAAGGSDLANVVRVDQHYTDATAVEFYHDARRATLNDHVPPSTSTLTPRLLLAGQTIEVHALAVAPTRDFREVHIRPAQQNEVHATSGYSLALAAGDLVFFAGRYADAPASGPGLAPEVRMPAGHLWKGLPIRMETEYVIAKKLVPTLKAAGCALSDAVLCQIYLRDPDDFAPEPRGIDGRRASCRACCNAHQRNRYASDQEYRERKKRNQLNWLARNPWNEGRYRQYRDAALLRIGEGTSEIQRLVISRFLGC